VRNRREALTIFAIEDVAELTTRSKSTISGNV
jgi:hypothetical protein